jgi:hypothetical protein
MSHMLLPSTLRTRKHARRLQSPPQSAAIASRRPTLITIFATLFRKTIKDLMALVRG